jgi:hypothetical protein
MADQAGHGRIQHQMGGGLGPVSARTHVSSSRPNVRRDERVSTGGASDLPEDMVTWC